MKAINLVFYAGLVLLTGWLLLSALLPWFLNQPDTLLNVFGILLVAVYLYVVASSGYFIFKNLRKEKPTNEVDD